MAKTKFGIFSLSQVPDLAKVVESFDDDLSFFELAERLGYDKVWIAEHLFSSYGLVTSTQVYAAAIAQRTKKVRIGMAVCAIPFNHPLRTASDFALVDILSHGRLDFGVGRAYQPHEFVGLGVPMDQSREMLAEGLDIVLKSWTQEKVSYRGKFWTIPEPVELLPKPVQKPHPPVYQATISPESFEQAARSGVHLQMASPFTYRTYRERWMDELEKNCRHYEAVSRDLGKDANKVERMLLLPFFVHEERPTSARDLQGARRVVLCQGDRQPARRRAANGRGAWLRAHHARGQEDARDGLPVLRQAARVWRLHRRRSRDVRRQAQGHEAPFRHYRVRVLVQHRWHRQGPRRARHAAGSRAGDAARVRSGWGDIMQLGYIGLGNMGAALARRLLRKDKMRVYDLRPETMARLADLGGIASQSP